MKRPIFPFIVAGVALLSGVCQADVPVSPTSCMGGFCIATYGTFFELKRAQTVKQGEGEKSLLYFEPKLVVSMVRGVEVARCEDFSAPLYLKFDGSTYRGGGCFKVPNYEGEKFVVVGVALKSPGSVANFLSNDGLCIWVKEPLPNANTGEWRAQRLGRMRCIEFTQVITSKLR